MPIVSLLGAPWDGSSSFQRGAARAPALIRDALWSPSSNAWNERGDNLAAGAVLADSGDLTLPQDAAAARDAIEHGVREVLSRGQRPLVLGGDHSITYPILRAWDGDDGSTPVIVHFDAHGDLYDHFDGDRFSHACPFARILEQRLASRLVQVGVRTLNHHQREQIERFGVECFEAGRWRDGLVRLAELRGPVYVSLDLDVLEPMLAPGISHPEPGGLSVREVLEALAVVASSGAVVIGADVVEYNPANDIRDLTARVAAKFVKELTGLLRR